MLEERSMNMQNNIVITNIQRMCFHDGPGIRTTVFTKGCSIHCPWCSNPENLSFGKEPYEMDGEKQWFGKVVSAESLFKILMKDSGFWEKDGGVTFSGGEALMQAEALKKILIRLKKEGIHTAVETALFVPREYVEEVIPYIDYVIADVKILDQDLCRKVLGGEVSLYLSNVEVLWRMGKLKLFRVPCCPEYTFTESNKKMLQNFFDAYYSIPVELFRIHNLGEKKYKSLHRSMWRSRGTDEKTLYQFRDVLRQQGVKADVISI